jgi:hypothetical protein
MEIDMRTDNLIYSLCTRSKWYPTLIPEREPELNKLYLVNSINGQIYPALAQYIVPNNMNYSEFKKAEHPDYGWLIFFNGSLMPLDKYGVSTYCDISNDTNFESVIENNELTGCLLSYYMLKEISKDNYDKLVKEMTEKMKKEMEKETKD